VRGENWHGFGAFLFPELDKANELDSLDLGSSISIRRSLCNPQAIGDCVESGFGMSARKTLQAHTDAAKANGQLPRSSLPLC
jgi:hypothetical protein